ncbi:hypothetical protein LTR62_008839 [Meristemomyces frigidus]|uniref:Heterokaryon incompatibility domain-containing protein n=1 Tax=Meristemomyces frigidus TaxID=1508187 RepID=A0AAN7TA91_9PEZI|nr:hypothetical protein LTR62_008839 [Meristemomyces frigidus]
MRLLNTDTLDFEDFLGKPPPYAILSHRWLPREISLKTWRKVLQRHTERDVQTESRSETESQSMAEREMRIESHKKILGFCNEACQQGIQYAWIDNCCIDTSSSTEHSEAINSMFEWYKEAKVCCVYLSDVPELSAGLEVVLEAMNKSVWFTRGWTLQELLAPRRLTFFTARWEYFGSRDEERTGQLIADATRIPMDILQGTRELTEASLAQRMSWLSKRKTTKPEDVAYSVLGIFEVNMPLLYGEGAVKAFIRLQQEITRKSPDESIFAWCMDPPALLNNWRGLLAPSPEYFAAYGDVLYSPESNTLADSSIYSWCNRGLMLQCTTYGVHFAKDREQFLRLNCKRDGSTCVIQLFIEGSVGRADEIKKRKAFFKWSRQQVPRWSRQQVPMGEEDDSIIPQVASRGTRNVEESHGSEKARLLYVSQSEALTLKKHVSEDEDCQEVSPREERDKHEPDDETSQDTSVVDVKDKKGRTPLWLAAENGHEAIVKILLETGKVNPDSKDKTGRTPLLCAVLRRNKAIVEMLLKTGKVDLGAKDEYERDALECAAVDWDETIIRMLFDTGKFNADSRDETGTALLSRAIRRGKHEFVKLLLDTGKVSLDLKNKTGKTPLWYAIEEGHEATVEMLLKTGKVDPNSKDEDDKTPLLLAAENGHEAIVKILLETGKVNPDSKDKTGRTPLLCAVLRRNKAIVEMLLKTGKVDLGAKDEYERDALECAAVDWDETIIRMLFDTGKFNADSRDETGTTLLSRAIRHGKHEFVKLLLDTGKASLSSEDKMGRTPLWYAVEGGHESTVEMLLKTGKVDVYRRDNEDRSALSRAAEDGNVSIVEMLLPPTKRFSRGSLRVLGDPIQNASLG